MKNENCICIYCQPTQEFLERKIAELELRIPKEWKYKGLQANLTAKLENYKNQLSEIAGA